MSDQFEMPNMNDLLGQAMKMQEQLLAAQQQAAAQTVEGVAGGGAVKVAMTGSGEAQRVTIDPKAVDPADVSMLEDLVLAAIRDAQGKAAALSQAAMGSLDMGGLGGLLGK